MFDTDLTKIRYVAIEVIKKSSILAKDVECGLLIGICKRTLANKKECKFLFLAVSDKSVRMYNLNDFHILTLDILDDDTRYMTVFTDTDKDQEASQNMVEEMVRHLEENDRLQGNDINKELIDAETYEGYPDAVLTEDNISESTTSKSTQNASSSGGCMNTCHGNYQNNASWAKKEPTLLNFTRQGKLPSIDTLKAMRAKVLKMAAGDYEAAILPIPVGDLPDKKAKEEDDDKDVKKTGAVRV